MNWSDVNLRQFIKIQDIVSGNGDETEKLISVMEVLLGEDVLGLPVSEFHKKAKEIEFVYKEVPSRSVPKTITVNNRKYKVDGLLGNITTSQYIDFTNYMKAKDYTQMLTPFIIPDGHKYNDGYDMEQVVSDIGDLDIITVNSIAFFFRKQFELFTRIFRRSLKRKKNKTVTEELMLGALTADLHNME